MEAKRKKKIKALAADMDITIEKLAELCGINANHLRCVSCGRATMTGHDLQLLSETTGVSADEIETRKNFYVKS